MQQQKNIVQVVDSDGLVIIPASGAGSLVRLVRSVVIVVFSVLIFGTPIVDFLAPAPAIKLMGAERIRDVRLKRAANLWDGSLFRLWEHDIRLRSGIRRWVTDRYGWMFYRWLGHAQRPLVVGDGGWLFLRSRIEISDDLETGYLARRAGASMAALQRRLAGLGLDPVFVPIPRKAAMLVDYLPPGLEPRSDVDRSIIADLRQRGLPSIDLWRAFADELDEPAYHLLGSHWTDEAQFAAATAVSERTGKMVSTLKRSTVVERSEPGRGAGETDLLAFGGMQALRQLPVAAGRCSLVVRDENQMPIASSASEPGRFVLVGTSFSAGRRFSLFLTHFFDEPVYNRSNPGGFPGDTLAGFIRDQPWQGTTEALVFETPNHHLIQDPVARLVAPLFALPPANPLVKQLSVDSELYLYGNGVDGASSTGRGIAIVNSGKLAHTGDGVLGVRVRGRVKQNFVLHLAPVGGESVKVMWKPGTGQVVLPIISATPLAGVVWFAIAPTSAGPSAGSISIKSIDIVSEVRPAPRIVLGASKPAVIDDGWETWIEIPEVALSATALLELELGVKGAFDGNLLVEARALGEVEPLQVQWTGLRKESLVVVSLAGFAGEAIEHVRISGSGPPPKKLLSRAVLRPGQSIGSLSEGVGGKAANLD